MGLLSACEQHVNDHRCLSLIIGHTDFGVPIYKDNIMEKYINDFDFDKSSTGDIKTADNIVVDEELTGVNILKGESRYNVAINIPLEFIWQPKEDISIYELALCVPFIGRKNIMKYEIDDSMTFLRHFKIIDYNK